ncbi:hypothetical protein [Streptomyces sp. R33]|uniref:Uncharacterized protein n=1 Tax=Streptomyces sp. R33 TaxID=3238629 RepID=A0AB39YGE0_9ACTN
MQNEVLKLHAHCHRKNPLPDSQKDRGHVRPERKTVSFQASVNLPLESFTSDVTLTYSSEDDLTGNRSYAGTVGKQTIELSFNNGPALTGPLDAPGLDHANSVVGTGSWQHAVT